MVTKPLCDTLLFQLQLDLVELKFGGSHGRKAALPALQLDLVELKYTE